MNLFNRLVDIKEGSSSPKRLERRIHSKKFKKDSLGPYGKHPTEKGSVLLRKAGYKNKSSYNRRHKENK